MQQTALQESTRKREVLATTPLHNAVTEALVHRYNSSGKRWNLDPKYKGSGGKGQGLAPPPSKVRRQRRAV